MKSIVSRELSRLVFAGICLIPIRELLHLWSWMAYTFATHSIPQLGPDGLEILFASYPDPAWRIETISIFASCAIYLALLAYCKTPGVCTLAGAALISLCITAPMYWLKQYIITLTIFNGQGPGGGAIHPDRLAGVIMALEVLIIVCLLVRAIRRPKDLSGPVSPGFAATSHEHAAGDAVQPV